MSKLLPSNAPPFAASHQLNRALDTPAVGSAIRTLPGFPTIPLQDREAVYDFLRGELCPGDLDRIADRLWWMCKQDSASISSLHRQHVKRRSIVVTEDPKLHLVWFYDRIFIKPLPRCITSHAFWRGFLCAAGPDAASTSNRIDPIRSAALGYLRTYAHLIRHESDLRIAQDPSLCLVPAEVTWEQFSQFASAFASIQDADVSPRYAYGEIRLTRLNLYAPILLRRAFFQRVQYQYAAYFAQYYAPLLFVMGVASIVLSGLQVCTVVDEGRLGRDSWVLGDAALWISVVVIIFACVVLVFLLLLLVYKVCAEWRVAIRDRRRLLKERCHGIADKV